jgi:hypothetical protein
VVEAQPPELPPELSQDTDIMSLYTSVEWETLCREVMKLKLTPRAELPDEAQELVAFRRLAPLDGTTRGTKGDQGEKQESSRNSGASSGGAENRTRVRKTSSDWHHARLPE